MARESLARASTSTSENAPPASLTRFISKSALPSRIPIKPKRILGERVDNLDHASLRSSLPAVKSYKPRSSPAKAKVPRFSALNTPSPAKSTSTRSASITPQPFRDLASRSQPGFTPHPRRSSIPSSLIGGDDETMLFETGPPSFMESDTEESGVETEGEDPSASKPVRQTGRAVMGEGRLMTPANSQDVQQSPTRTRPTSCSPQIPRSRAIRLPTPPPSQEAQEPVIALSRPLVRARPAPTPPRAVAGTPTTLLGASIGPSPNPRRKKSPRMEDLLQNHASTSRSTLPGNSGTPTSFASSLHPPADRVETLVVTPRDANSTRRKKTPSTRRATPLPSGSTPSGSTRTGSSFQKTRQQPPATAPPANRRSSTPATKKRISTPKTVGARRKSSSPTDSSNGSHPRGRSRVSLTPSAIKALASYDRTLLQPIEPSSPSDDPLLLVGADEDLVGCTPVASGVGLGLDTVGSTNTRRSGKSSASRVIDFLDATSSSSSKTITTVRALSPGPSRFSTSHEAASDPAVPCAQSASRHYETAHDFEIPTAHPASEATYPAPEYDHDYYDPAPAWASDDGSDVDDEAGPAGNDTFMHIANYHNRLQGQSGTLLGLRDEVVSEEVGTTVGELHGGQQEEVPHSEEMADRVSAQIREDKEDRVTPGLPADPLDALITDASGSPTHPVELTPELIAEPTATVTTINPIANVLTNTYNEQIAVPSPPARVSISISSEEEQEAEMVQHDPDLSVQADAEEEATADVTAEGISADWSEDERVVAVQDSQLLREEKEKANGSADADYDEEAAIPTREVLGAIDYSAAGDAAEEEVEDVDTAEKVADDEEEKEEEVMEEAAIDKPESPTLAPSPAPTLHPLRFSAHLRDTVDGAHHVPSSVLFDGVAIVENDSGQDQAPLGEKSALIGHFDMEESIDYQQTVHATTAKKNDEPDVRSEFDAIPTSHEQENQDETTSSSGVVGRESVKPPIASPTRTAATLIKSTTPDHSPRITRNVFKAFMADDLSTSSVLYAMPAATIMSQSDKDASSRVGIALSPNATASSSAPAVVSPDGNGQSATLPDEAEVAQEEHGHDDTAGHVGSPCLADVSTSTDVTDEGVSGDWDTTCDGIVPSPSASAELQTNPVNGQDLAARDTEQEEELDPPALAEDEVHLMRKEDDSAEAEDQGEEDEDEESDEEREDEQQQSSDPVPRPAGEKIVLKVINRGIVKIEPDSPQSDLDERPCTPSRSRQSSCTGRDDPLSTSQPVGTDPLPSRSQPSSPARGTTSLYPLSPTGIVHPSHSSRSYSQDGAREARGACPSTKQPERNSAASQTVEHTSVATPSPAPPVLRRLSSHDPQGPSKLESMLLRHSSSSSRAPSRLSQQVVPSPDSSPAHPVPSPQSQNVPSSSQADDSDQCVCIRKVTRQSLGEELSRSTASANRSLLGDNDESITSVVEVSSLDPRAAARAAAILKMNHAYIEHGVLDPDQPPAQLKPTTPRRKSFQSTQFDSIASSRKLDKTELLFEAELEIVASHRSRSRSRSKSMSRFRGGSEAPSEVYFPGGWVATPKRKRSILPTIAPSPAVQSDAESRAEGTERVWGVKEWKKLEKVYRVEREAWMKEREVKALPTGLLGWARRKTMSAAEVQAKEWDGERVVKRFEEEFVKDRDEGGWSRELVALRVKALERRVDNLLSQSGNISLSDSSQPSLKKPRHDISGEQMSTPARGGTTAGARADVEPPSTIRRMLSWVMPSRRQDSDIMTPISQPRFRSGQQDQSDVKDYSPSRQLNELEKGKGKAQELDLRGHSSAPAADCDEGGVSITGMKQVLARPVTLASNASSVDATIALPSSSTDSTDPPSIPPSTAAISHPMSSSWKPPCAPTQSLLSSSRPTTTAASSSPATSSSRTTIPTSTSTSTPTTLSAILAAATATDTRDSLDSSTSTSASASQSHLYPSLTPSLSQRSLAINKLFSTTPSSASTPANITSKGKGVAIPGRSGRESPTVRDLVRSFEESGVLSRKGSEESLRRVHSRPM